nr:uncharacterized protein LOC109192376 [Ipomoea trifida]
MELSKTKKRKESAMDRLKVLPGSTLDVQGFLAQAPDPALAQEIVDALRACGLFDLCTFQVEGYYPRDVAEFYEKGTSQGSVFISRVNGQYVQITESDIRREFNLPESNLTVDNHAFNLRDFWNRIRGEGTSEEPKSTNIKKTILKRNFEMLVDILYKCIDGRIGSLDDVSTKNIGVLHAIMQKIKYNWASPRVTEGIEEVVRATMDLETATAIQQEIDEEVATILPYEGMEGAAFDEDEGIIADGEDLNLVQDTDADLEKFVADQFDDPSAEKQHPKEMVEAMRKSREEMYQPSGVLEQEDIEATYNREDMFNEEEAFEIHEERNDAGADQEAFVGGEVEDTVTVTVPQTEPTNRDGEKVGTTFIDPLTAIVPYNPSTQIAIELAEDTNVEAFPERMRSRSQICDPGQPTSISRLSSSESHREESPMDIPPVAPPPAKEHDIPLIPEPIFLVKGVALNDAINKLTTEFSSKKGEASSSAISALDDIKVKQDKFFGEIGCALRNLKDIEESRDAIIHQNLKNIVQKFRDFVAENDKDHKETRKKIQDNFTAVIRNQNELIQSQQNQIEELNAKLATVQDTLEMYFRDIQSKVKPVGEMQICIEDIRRQQLLDSAILQSFDATKKGERSSQAGRSSTGRGGYSQSGRGQAGRGQGSRPICR